MQLTLGRNPQTWRQPGQFPPNHRLPDIYRLAPEFQPDRQGEGEQARGPIIALVEAALLAATRSG